MVASTLAFTVLDGLIKALGPSIPPPEVSFFRALFAAIPLFALALARVGVAGFRGLPWGRHLARGLFGLASMFGFFYALPRLGLAELVAISFAGPLFVTTLSVLWLGERVGPRRAAAVVVGFLGVLIVLRPGAALISPVALAALVATLCGAISSILTRPLGSRQPPLVIAAIFSGIACVGAALGLPFVWVTPEPLDLAILALAGLSGGCGTLFLTRAYVLAPASVVAPFEYVTLIWAVALGYVGWGETPDLGTWVGGAVIMASGLYILHRERVLRRPESAAPRAAPPA